MIALRSLQARSFVIAMLGVVTVFSLIGAVGVLRMSAATLGRTTTALTASSMPAWTLEWQAPTSGQGALSPDVALLSGLHVQRTVDGSQHAPTHIHWLLKSSSLALATVQVDAAAQYQSLVYVAHASNGNSWIEDSLDLGKPEPCAKGVLAPQVLGFLGSVCSTGLTNAGLVSILNWNTTGGVQFVAYRVNVTALQIPVGASVVRVESKTCWVTYDGGFGNLEAQLSQRQILGVAGQADSQRIEAVASLLLQHLDVFSIRRPAD